MTGPAGTPALLPGAVPAAALPGRSGELVAALGSLPGPVVVAFALVTALGGLWWLFALLAVGYLAGDATGVVDRRRAAFLVGVALGVATLIAALKHAFALPRPPGAATVRGAQAVPPAVRPVYGWVTTADGFGFPSGHAAGSVAVYGAAALTVRRRSRARAIGAAGAIAGLVALSRVVIGVHYLADVVGGAITGAALLAVACRLGRGGERPGRVLSLAVGIGLAGGLVAFSAETMAALGGALGARISWGIAGDRVLAAAPTPREALLATALGLPTSGVLLGVAFGSAAGPVVGFAAGAGSLGVVVAAPLVARRLVGGQRLDGG